MSNIQPITRKRTLMSDTLTHQLQVQGMSCQHCVKAVTKAIHARDPAADVAVALPQGTVTVHTALGRDIVRAAIDEEGYEVQD
jgi:copper chaperone